METVLETGDTTFPRARGDRLRALFATDGVTEAEERELDHRLDTMAREFLQAREASSDISLAELAGYFRESRVPQEPADLKAYLAALAESVVRHSTRTASPRFIGHMTSALPYFVRPLSKLVTALNQNMVKSETAKALTPLERQALAMMHRLVFGFPDEFYEKYQGDSASTLGAVVSGGTVANMTALWCARNAALGPVEDFAGIEQEGLAAGLRAHGHAGAVVLASSLAHYSVQKSADLLGLGSRALLKVPTGPDGRTALPELRRVLDECRRARQRVIAVVGVAGTTDTGAIDPLPGMAEIASEAGVHFHVDAAWAGPLLFSEEHRHRLSGIERADSVTMDGHKQLYLPMGIGMVFLRDPGLARCIEKQARYIVRPRSVDLGKRALEGSRPAMALFLHAALSLIGHRGYGALIDEGIRKTRYLAQAVRRRPDFELLADPVINIVVYRHLPPRWRRKAWAKELEPADEAALNAHNERLQKAQRRAGRTFVSRTMLDHTRHGRTTSIVGLRAVLANPLTTESDIDAVLEDQASVARSLAG